MSILVTGCACLGKGSHRCSDIHLNRCILMSFWQNLALRGSPPCNTSTRFARANKPQSTEPSCLCTFSRLSLTFLHGVLTRPKTHKLVTMTILDLCLYLALTINTKAGGKHRSVAIYKFNK